MKSLLQTIRTDLLQARKERDKFKSAALTTLYAEAERKGFDDGKRESTDAEVIAVCKKFIANIEDTLKVTFGEGLVAEKELIERYLPQQFTEEELTIIVEQIVDLIDAGGQQANMGLVMKTLKEKFDGKYDGRMASMVAKKTLS